MVTGTKSNNRLSPGAFNSTSRSWPNINKRGAKASERTMAEMMLIHRTEEASLSDAGNMTARLYLRQTNGPKIPIIERKTANSPYASGSYSRVTMGEARIDNI